QGDLFLPAGREQRKDDNFLHWDKRGALRSNATKMLQEPVEFLESWPPAAFVCFPDQPQFFDNNQGVVEGLSC
ncbi:MAG: hypothetical protein WA652_20470, partial [Xanthobacteraceae bacterium]